LPQKHIGQEGTLYFSMDALLANTSNITKILDAEVYQNIAITPSYSNIKSNPSKPRLSYDEDYHHISITISLSPYLYHHISITISLSPYLYHHISITISQDTFSQEIIISSLDKNGKWSNHIQPAYDIGEYKLNIDSSTIKVTAQILDRFGNLSKRSIIKIN
jgi:hypothetical protein